MVIFWKLLRNLSVKESDQEEAEVYTLYYWEVCLIENVMWKEQTFNFYFDGKVFDHIGE